MTPSPVIRLTKKSLSDTSASGPTELQRGVALKLLALGGKAVLWHTTEQYGELLLERGRRFKLPVELAEGKPSSCHTSAASLWSLDVDLFTLVTGFALNGGVWRRHSWVIDDVTLIETTGEGEQYFGVALDKLEAARFWGMEFLMARYGNMMRLLAEASDQRDRSKATKRGRPRAR